MSNATRAWRYYIEGGGKKGKGAPPPPPSPAKSKFEAEAFNPAHPDGRYALNLDRPVEHAVASRLFQLEDNAPGQNIVNVRYCGKPMTEDPVASGWPETSSAGLKGGYRRRQKRNTLGLSYCTTKTCDGTRSTKCV